MSRDDWQVLIACLGFAAVLGQIVNAIAMNFVRLRIEKAILEVEARTRTFAEERFVLKEVCLLRRHEGGGPANGRSVAGA